MRAVVGGMFVTLLGLLLVVGLQTFEASQLEGDLQELGRRYVELSGQVEYGERVVDLPDDAGLWWLTFFHTSKNSVYTDANSRRLAAMFASHDRLRSLAAQTKPQVIYSTDPQYQAKLRNLIGGVHNRGLPAIVLQRPDGKVVFKRSAAAIPYDPEQLADDIQADIDADAIARGFMLPVSRDCGPWRPRPDRDRWRPNRPDRGRIPDTRRRGSSGTSAALWVVGLPLLAGGAAWLLVRRRRA